MSNPVIIFGATGAVGRALSQRLLDTGQPLHLIGRDADALGSMAKKFNASSAVCDVLDEDAIRTSIDAYPANDCAGLAFCIGSIVLKPLRAASSNDFMQTYQLNVVAAALAIQQCATRLKRGNGSVVLFSSIAASQGFHNHSVIAAAKAGIIGLTVALAAELAPQVRVNCIAPSLSKSAMAKSLTDNERTAENIARQHPLPRLGRPDDHAALAAFLLNPDSSWITGQTLHVDGGRSCVSLPG
ncbi:MAG: SDR family oxidoreductase [Gammaproteobacteria bacterium]